MKISIVGPGAMGCLLAAFLSKTKEEIWILDYKKERAELINKKGIAIEGISGNWQAKVKATCTAKEIGVSDLVIICVKSYDTKKASAQAKGLISEKSTVLTLQNGIGNIETISEAIGEDRVIAGITSHGATLTQEARVRHAGKGETLIGRLDTKITPDMRLIREVFNRAGMETKITRDIKSLIWLKLIINCGINALTAITRLNNAKINEYEGTKRLMRLAVTEGIRVIKRKRIRLSCDDPLAKVEAICEATGDNVSSMLQDVMRRKRTEIDFINGVVVRLGQELNIPVPVNQTLVDLVKTIEATYGLTV